MKYFVDYFEPRYNFLSLQVLPYEPRTYPLSDEIYEEMIKGMPLDHAPFMSFQHLPTKTYNIVSIRN